MHSDAVAYFKQQQEAFSPHLNTWRVENDITVPFSMPWSSDLTIARRHPSISLAMHLMSTAVGRQHHPAIIPLPVTSSEYREIHKPVKTHIQQFLKQTNR